MPKAYHIGVEANFFPGVNSLNVLIILPESNKPDLVIDLGRWVVIVRDVQHNALFLAL